MNNEDQNINNNINVEEANEDQEWANALDDFSSEHGVKTEENKDDDDANADGKKTDDDKNDDPNKQETPEQKAARESAEAEKNKNPVPPVDRSIRDQRATQRELIEDENAMVADIQEQLFADTPKELLDADGDPIRTIQDVMKLVNPATEKAFTAEEATLWLMAAQQNLSKINEANSQKAKEYAQVNLTLKDEADNVKEKYGELLKTMPDLAKEVHAAFMETLIKDEKTNIIIKAPVSIEKFYDVALRGYVKLAEQLASKAEVDKQHEQELEKANKEKEKIRMQNDRQDIYSAGKGDDRSDEDKEWDSAVKNYYGK